jgi:membrane fusion protein (multidrug efflux system)
VGLSATVDVDISQRGGSALGMAAAPAPAYATRVLDQPLQQAQMATDAIVARNMAN